MEYRRKNKILAWQYHPEAAVPAWLIEKAGDISTFNIPTGVWFTLENGMVQRWCQSTFHSVFEPVTS